MKKIKTSSEKSPDKFNVEKSNGIVTRIESCFDVSTDIEKVKDRETGEEKDVTIYNFTFAFDNILIKNREKLISSLIRLKYSVNDELSILRQKDTKPDEYNEYYEFAEAAKTFSSEVFA